MLDDRLFVALARKTGYPGASDLERCRATQIAWARDGNAVSLLEVCFAQGALTPRQYERYERWAAQIAKADQGPITDTVAAPSGVTEQVVVHQSAADLAALPPRCEKCGKDLDDLGVLDGRVRVTVDGRKVCGPCFNAVPVRTPSAPRVPSAKKKSVVFRILETSKGHLKALVKRRPRRERPEPEPLRSQLPVFLLAGSLVLVLGGTAVWLRFFRKVPAPVVVPVIPFKRPVPVAGPVPVPVPAPVPAPAPVTVAVPVPVPAPVPAPVSSPALDEARDLYSKAEDLYRTSFAGKTPQEKQGLRDSRALLEKARGLLEKRPPDADAAYDTLSAQVSSLLHDVEKRQGATGG